MTYENAIDWAIDNVAKEPFDDFNQWYREVQEQLQTPELFEVNKVNRELRESWFDEVGSFEREITIHDDYGDLLAILRSMGF